MHVVIINGSPRVQKFSNTDKIIQKFGEGLKKEGATYELYSLSNRKEWDAAREAILSHKQIIFALPLYVECVPSLMLEFLEQRVQSQTCLSYAESRQESRNAKFLEQRVQSQTCLSYAESLPTEQKGPSQLMEQQVPPSSLEWPSRDGSRRSQMSFILHGGFDEGHQLRLGERFLQSLPEQMGCTYGGCLVQGGSFLIRMRDDERMKKAMDKKLAAYTKMGQSFVHNGNFMTSEAKKFTGPEKNPWIVRLLFPLFFQRIVRKNFERIAHQWGCTRPLDDKVYSSSQQQ